MIRPSASFHKAADLVRLWGNSSLPDGQTVEDLLTIEGVPLWSVISPMLAFGPIYQALSNPSQQTDFNNYSRTLIKKARGLAFDAAVRIIGNKKGCARWPDRPSFIFLGFSHYIYRETLQPIAVSLAERSDCSVIVLDDIFPMQTRKISQNGLMFQSLWQHWDADVAQTHKKMRKELKEATLYLTRASVLQGIVTSNGLSWENVKPVFDWLMETYLPRMLNQAAIALHIVNRHRPALLVSPDVHDPRTRVFCMVGHLTRVKTLEIQFGFYGVNDIEWRFFKADHLAVTGETNLDVMIGHGIPREKMTVTGSPRYDSVLSWPSELVSRVRNDLKIPDGEKMVLFASQPYYSNAFSSEEIRRKMIKALFDAGAQKDGLVIVVKPHPLEDTAELVELSKGMHNVRFADKLFDIRDLIKAADGFVTFFSGTAFDALVMNKPTVNLAFPGACANNLFEECGATFVVRNTDDMDRLFNVIRDGHMPELLEELLPARERFLWQWFYKLDGRSADRIEDIALEMASFQPLVY